VTISIPEKLLDESLPTCGWLLEQVECKYAQLIKDARKDVKSKQKLKKKLIVALKSIDKNESIDHWLLHYDR
jgi:hypothetical protein